ncbi:putative glyoxalase superfamily metalloenzyme YdcJ [Cupriavidus gilardii J11]|uniref:2-oxoadipate dioxygenase/decarboxylase n=1 Tax=Cupriavidus gilardii J11 TaxID=936133 RepID=A0A562BTT1_9BURK|nr:VOC family protein [Cupriavidus gilardii]TWG88678.1 putative glyoxalase superfamily metalloenzyme YdcJ [Cupriavidus gilardii J11]
MTASFVPPSAIRSLFSRAMSDMYRSEVPQYGTLMELVADVNARVLAEVGAARAGVAGQELRLEVERHGAIRVGTAAELATIRRLFAVMGMAPVGYYDLSIAGVPVHSTAFRPMDNAGLAANPFRVFTSLLRLDLIADPALRDAAKAVLRRRSIFTPRCLALIDQFESQGGLSESQASAFVTEALETFRWHGKATVDAGLYQQLRQAHPLIADIVCFQGPHINHLTPRTLDIDAVQAEMPARGIKPKAVIEGPPTRRCPILLRQTSFLALSEPVTFAGEGEAGTHTARFGEIEQRGVALTPQGRQRYDEILARVREAIVPAGDGSNAAEYREVLAREFSALPDDHDTLRREGLAYYRYSVGDAARVAQAVAAGGGVDALVEAGALVAEPITYEDFLPVSAAGIFQSNLGDEQRDGLAASPNRAAFEQALGAPVHDELALYAAQQRDSLAQALKALGLEATA